MPLYLAAFLIGVVAGLRSMTAPAAVSWAAHYGWIHLEDTWVAFLRFAYTPYIITLLAIGELINDKLPATPSRKVPMAFGARIVSGAVCGAALGSSHGSVFVGLAAGIVGAVVGTLGGAEFRSRLAKAFGKDLPAALIEDVIAVGGAFFIMTRS